MKKVLAVIAVVAVVCVAGAAFAQTRGRDDARRMPHQMQQEEFGGMGCRFGGMDRGFGSERHEQNPGHRDGFGQGFGLHRQGHHGLGFTPDMPEDIRAKAVEAAKLRIDLEAALAAKPIDKAKAMEIFGKVQQAQNEVEMWKFGKRLEMMEDFRTQRELNRKMPPARRMPPAPADEAPAPKPDAPAPEE